jgi:hypothetical protein
MPRFCIFNPDEDSYQLLNATTCVEAAVEAKKIAEDFGYAGPITIHRALNHKELLTENGEDIINSLHIAQSLDELMLEETGCELLHFKGMFALAKEINAAVLEIALRHAVDDVAAYFTAAPLTAPETEATEAV